MHTLKLLFIYYVLIVIWIIVFIDFSFIIISIINRLFFFFFIIILERNDISSKGAKALAEALELNNNLVHLNLCIFLLLLT